MQYILLDTNILIYSKGEKILDESMQLLSRLLLDSEEYKLCIHPLSIDELKKHNDEEEKARILSIVNVYKTLDQTPEMTTEFLCKCREIKNTHDYNDYNLLYMLEINCVNYFITNDKSLQCTAEKLEFKERVFSIDEAIDFLSNKDDLTKLKAPMIITERLIYSINTNDSFFESLREDYSGFDTWLENKKRCQVKAYVSFLKNDTIGSLLMLKIEDETERYNQFEIPFNKGKRVKISTFKVADNGKSIGEALLKIAFDFTLMNGIQEIYATAFEKQKQLIGLLIDYGFKLFTYKDTVKQNGTIEKEGIYLKKISKEYTEYPMIKLIDQNIFIVPIQHEYCHMLFPEIFEVHQIASHDIDGTSTYSNVIKKVYISKSKMMQIRTGDILIFYASQMRKALICAGVVDDVFRANDVGDYDTFVKIVKRRTVYQSEYLREAYDKGYLIILFKHYVNFSKHISLKEAMQTGILNGPPQSIQGLSKDKFEILVELSGSDKQIKI